MSISAIRRATLEDMPAVRALLVATWHDAYDPLIGAEKVTAITDVWHSVENLSRQLATPHGSFLVAETEGVLVGHAFANAQNAPLLLLTRLYVLPAFQRRGIGAALIEAALARHPGCDRVRLEVKAGNEKALAFYRRAGFQPVGERIVEAMNHIVMDKPLR
jgi:ribosomal protein S18 acetylase RimI-like enzyme